MLTLYNAQYVVLYNICKCVIRCNIQSSHYNTIHYITFLCIFTTAKDTYHVFNSSLVIELSEYMLLVSKLKLAHGFSCDGKQLLLVLKK